MQPQTEVKTSRSTLLVGCRHPHGLILKLHEKYKAREPLAAGQFAEVEMMRSVGEPVVLKGYADRAIPVMVDARGQYGVTRVDTEFFNEWLRQNKGSDLIANHVVFAAATEPSLKAMGNELKGERHGYESIDPSKPGIRGIEPAKASA